MLSSSVSLWSKYFDSLPVISKSPVSNCFRTITLFPLCTPASRIATAPGARLALRDLLCLEKKFFDVPFGALKLKHFC